MTTPSQPSPPLVAPVISNQGSTIAALALAGRGLKQVADQQLQIMGATVVSNAVFGVVGAQQSFSVVLDTDTATPVEAHALNGIVPVVGARVMCILYPPRGVLVLGQIDDAHLLVGSVTSPFSTVVQLQSFDKGVPGGELELNLNGGQVLLGPTIANESFTVPALSQQYSRDTAAHSGLASTSFATVGAALITFEWPASGQVTVHHKTRITSASAAGAYQADVIVKNVTQSTTPYGGSVNNSWNMQAAGALSTNNDIGGFVTIGSTAAGGAGTANFGDILTVQLAYAVTGGTWAIGDTALLVVPSL